MFQLVVVLVTAALVAIDRVTKIAVCNGIKLNGPVEFFGGLFQLRYVENTGAAFSSFSGNTAILTVFTLLIIVVCLALLLMHKFPSKFINACLVMIVSGGIGNEIDRIMNGFVVDFIEPMFMNFAVFNFADCCITVGAFMLIGWEIKDMITTERKSKND